MNLRVILKLAVSHRWVCGGDVIGIDGAIGTYPNARHLQPPFRRTGGFSLLLATLALGVAAFCLLVLAWGCYPSA